jgi:AraC family transcriptional regulator
MQELTQHLRDTPNRSLRDLAIQFRVSVRTIENIVKSTTGTDLRELRKEILVEKFTSLVISSPTSEIKELSFAAGYKSARSFARAVRRASGFSPQQLRSNITEDMNSNSSS